MRQRDYAGADMQLPMTAPARTCGSGSSRCTLCCRLLPVPDLKKPGNARCGYQRATGCAIYHDPGKGFPTSCALWACRWLTNDHAQDLRRPDRSHYVIDVVPDRIRATDKNGNSQTFEAVQVWVDPGHRTAHHDPALRAWIDAEAKPAIIRFPVNEGIVLLPPSVTGGDWIVHGAPAVIPRAEFKQRMERI